ncbi:hypothetical protein [Streptomyces sp. 6N223]|uniref:hypothetical protein n=1 Tax=Streptomyces sp. 6N223 TaxID=3457412 RepID=UPI003FCFA1DE
MKPRTRHLQTVAVAAAGLLALTACGSDKESASQGADGQESTDGATGETGESEAGESLASLPPEEIADRAQEALQSATSLRMRTLGDPEVTGIGLDLHMDRDGSCDGSVTQGGAGSVELLVREDDEVWMKPDTAFWQSQLAVGDASTVSLLDGSYLYGHTSDPEMSQLAGTCSLAALQADIESDDGSGGADQVGPETEYNGTPVITLSGPDDEGNEVTMLIATEGEPYPLLVRTMENGTETEIELSQYNEPVEFEEPPAEQVLNVADFRSGNIEG